jgi:hypothetical protein
VVAHPRRGDADGFGASGLAWGIERGWSAGTARFKAGERVRHTAATLRGRLIRAIVVLLTLLLGRVGHVASSAVAKINQTPENISVGNRQAILRSVPFRADGRGA